MPTIIAETKIRFEIWCRECGAGLCGMTEVNGETVEVEPCPDCIREAEYRGETEAIEESKNNYEEGYENGYENGYKKAYEEMRYEGMLEGLGESGEKRIKPLCMSRKGEK